MTKEEYRAFKQQEKADVFEKLSAATQKLLSAEHLKEYADMQAIMPGQSVSNVLLLMDQKPEATLVGTYEDWKKENAFPKKGEKAIMTLAADYYQKPDGTKGMTSKVVKVFDISQTTAEKREVSRAVSRGAADLIMKGYPPAAEIPELPNGEYAIYHPDKKTVYVKAGLDPDTKFFAIAREQAVAMMMKGDALTRADVITDAGMSAYIVTKRYGFEPPNIEFGRLASRFYGKEEKEVREKLGGIRFTADRIHQKVQEQAELSRSIRETER